MLYVLDKFIDITFFLDQLNAFHAETSNKNVNDRCHAFLKEKVYRFFLLKHFHNC